RLAVPLGELIERLASEGRLFRPLDAERLRINDFFRLRLLAKQLESPTSTNILASLVTHEIRRHGKQPRPFAHDGLLPDRAEKRLLRHFFRPVAIPQPPCEISHERLVVFAEQAVDVVQDSLLTTPWQSPRDRLA